MSSAFFHDDKILQQTSTIAAATPLPLLYSVEDTFDIESTVQVILKNEYKKIALQFPDELLPFAPSVSSQLKRRTRSNNGPRHICILGDTSYGSCCVDEVAAERILVEYIASTKHFYWLDMSADFIVHYGRACMSKTTRLPVLYVFGRKQIDVEHFTQAITSHIVPHERVLVFYDMSYHYFIPEVEKAFHAAGRGETVVFTRVKKEVPKSDITCGNSKCCNPGNSCSTGSNIVNDSNSTTYECRANSDCNSSCMSTHSTGNTPKPEPGISISELNGRNIGDEDATLTNLMMTNSNSKFYCYNPETKVVREEAPVNRSLMRRYHYIEKTRDASIIGIVVATLGVARYREVISQLQDIIKNAEKKSYLIVVGKLNEFKLGNFQEIDIFVIVACNEHTLIDSKNYYKPVITPFELEVALVRGKEWTGEYHTDFVHVLQLGGSQEDLPEEESMRYSLNSQKVMRNPKHQHERTENGETRMDLTTRNNNMEITTTSFATSFLSSRSWKGLEQRIPTARLKRIFDVLDIGETPVAAPVQGRSGIAKGYEGES